MRLYAARKYLKGSNHTVNLETSSLKSMLVDQPV